MSNWMCVILSIGVKLSIVHLQEVRWLQIRAAAMGTCASAVQNVVLPQAGLGTAYVRGLRWLFSDKVP